MKYREFNFFLYIISLHEFCYGYLVINTWKFPNATEAAWDNLVNSNEAIDAVEAGCSYCESHQCDLTVGFGGSPDESGETTLDALIFNGKTMDAGAVADLRKIRDAISVAKHVLLNTEHTLLVGNQATAFAVKMGFIKENLSTNVSTDIWKSWENNNCQPNYWKNVQPDPRTSCGPYSPLLENSVYYNMIKYNKVSAKRSHDTIGMIALDNDANIVAGTSTNGLRHKIPGRVGDSPMPGSGAYADNSVGAACATGDGDIMMRFLPSFLTVEKMRDGLSPTEAARIAINRITAVYPKYFGAVIAATVDGEYGAACNGMAEFPFCFRHDNVDKVTVVTIKCTNPP